MKLKMPDLWVLVVGEWSIFRVFIFYFLQSTCCSWPPGYCLHKFTMKSVITFDRSVHMNNPHTPVKRSKQTLAVIKNKICKSHFCATHPWNSPYLRNFTLYLTCRLISLSHACSGSGIWQRRALSKQRSLIDLITAWRGEEVLPLCWAASRSLHQPVKTHCDKDMHSWSRVAVFRARISWLVRSGSWSVCSNFFPRVKVKSGLQSELRGDCQLHWSQETSPHPPAPWLLTLTAFSLPSSLKSWNFITSAIMKPFSKSVWIFPAACGALVPFCHGEKRKRKDKWIVLEKMDYSMRATWCLIGW